ncbi:AAA family ATPase [Bradyrhizobium manausense]|uniref:Wzz/FepE/Etk N-terminal domain-containing protein n=1 Tax=Bradyrhizobium manausense TaxID=989370 RepID=UPI001BA70093|nr:Wzz/FepE/Etk N-terminal domain-containing protein [Bradyrhizobium manausense]MBR1092297.1 AAA family ATPase [Bradyrhizobium manausense]
MLQVGPQTFKSKTDSHEQFNDLASFKDLLLAIKSLVRRQLPYIIFTLLVCVGLASAYVLTASKKYTSTAALIIDSRKTQLLQQQSSPLGVDTPLDSATVDSQVEIITSEKVALSVIKDLDLIHNPEFTEPGLIGRIIGPVFALLSAPESASSQSITRNVLENLLKNLNVKRRGLSYVIDVSYKSRDPDLSARIANGIAEAYFVDALEAKYQASRRAATWLQDRLKELRAQASSADRAVVDYKAKNNIVDTGGRLLNEQQLAETNSALTIARAQTAEAQARYDRLTEILKSDDGDTGHFFNDIATVADSLRNDVITRLRQQYLDLSAREADWSKRYGAQHLAVVNLRNQMREIRRSILDELRRIGETYKSDLEIAKARESSVQASLKATIDQSNDTSQAQIILRDLESNAQSARALSDNFLQLYMLSVQQQSFPMTDARLITDASPALKPSDPKTLLIIAGAIVGGAFLGFGAGWLRDALDQVIRTGQQVEALIGVSCVAVVPSVKSARGPDRASAPIVSRVRSALALSQANAPGSSGQRHEENAVLDQQTGVIRLVEEEPFSRFTESIRSIKVAADVHFMDEQTRVLGVISALPNEGKTTIAASLAKVVALSGARVVLVDADLRNPSLTRTMASTAKVGLLEVVLEGNPLDAVLLEDPATGLAFLPMVSTSRVAQSSEILSSSGMSKLMAALRERYEWVIVDLPPLSPIIDARTTVKLIDGYLLVIEWGRTHREAIGHALKDAPMLEGKILGAVLNKADIGQLNRYDSFRGNYYQARYYDRYGYVD